MWTGDLFIGPLPLENFSMRMYVCMYVATFTPHGERPFPSSDDFRMYVCIYLSIYFTTRGYGDYNPYLSRNR